MKTVEEIRLEIYVLEVKRNHLEEKIDVGIVDPAVDDYMAWIRESEQLTTEIWKLNRKLSKAKRKIS